jgi:hypothetical protein
MISPETRVQIRRYFYAEHWKIGTIATALDVHPDSVRRAIEVERFHHAEPLRPSMVDPYLPFVREVLEQHPRPVIDELRAHPVPESYLDYLRLKLRQAAAALPANLSRPTDDR